jgi:DNA-binding winged helix-turn-helix (wHTH) protein
LQQRPLDFSGENRLASEAILAEALGMAAFESLRAEDEPWLPEVFEAPPEFDLIIGSRSVIIFGEAGSGKTAVYQALARSSLTTEGKPKRLLIEWHPKPPKSGVEIDSYLVEQQLAQVFDACALSLLTHLAYYPHAFADAPGWAQGTLTWFIRHYLQGDFELRTGSLLKEIGETGQALLAQLQASPVREALSADAAPELVIAELVKVLAEVDLAGAWVLADRLEAWSETEPERLAAGLTAFLSTLGLFEQSGFAYKMLLPATLAPFLSGVSGVARRRLDVHHLRWPKDKLETLVIKRLSLALGREISSLADICEDKTLSNWLERCGGYTPHGWLEYIRPVVAAYIDRNRRGRFEPVPTEEWRDIRRRHPPPLILDKQRKRVIVGEREIKELSEGQYALLEYLYERAGQVCTRSELYYRAARGLAYEPRVPSDPGWEAPKDYSGQLDTAIWRLREMIEPGYVDNNKDSFFIITVKGKGYRLENAYKSFG